MWRKIGIIGTNFWGADYGGENNIKEVERSSAGGLQWANREVTTGQRAARGLILFGWDNTTGRYGLLFIHVHWKHLQLGIRRVQFKPKCSGAAQSEIDV